MWLKWIEISKRSIFFPSQGSKFCLLSSFYIIWLLTCSKVLILPAGASSSAAYFLGGDEDKREDLESSASNCSWIKHRKHVFTSLQLKEVTFLCNYQVFLSKVHWLVTLLGSCIVFIYNSTIASYVCFKLTSWESDRIEWSRKRKVPL